MVGGPSRRRRRRRIIGGGGGGGGIVAVAVDVITRSILVWVVCIQGSSWRRLSNTNTNNGDASTITTTSFLVVEGVTFFRPFSVLSSVFMGEQRPRTLPSVAAAVSGVAQAAKTEPDTKKDDGVDQQQQAAQTEEEEAEDDEHSSPAADDDRHTEIADNNNNNSNTSDRSNIAAGNSNENEEEEVSWFHDMEFEDYNAAATLAGETTSTTSTTALDDCQLHPMLQIPLAVSLNDLDSHNHHHHSHQHYPNNNNNIRAIRAYCDSGATRTVMSYESARRLGWLKQLDRRYAGQATSVGGSCRVLGRLPAGLVNFHLQHHVNNVNNNNHNNKRDNTNNSDNHDDGDSDRRMIVLQSPTITVLEDLPSSSSSTCEEEDDDGNGGFELLLGLDFLREYQAILDLRNEELRLLVKRKEYSIPFLRPRSSVSSSSTCTSSTSTSCDAAHDDKTLEDHGREQETHSTSIIHKHKRGEFFRGGRSPFQDDNDHDDDDDDDYEDFDETLDMSGV